MKSTHVLMSLCIIVFLSSSCSSFYTVVDSRYAPTGNRIVVIAGETGTGAELAAYKIAEALSKTGCFDAKFLDAQSRVSLDISNKVAGPYKSGYISVIVDFSMTDRGAVSMIGGKLGSDYICMVWVASREVHQYVMNKVRLFFQVFDSSGSKLLGNGEYEVVYMQPGHASLGFAPRSFEEAMSGVSLDIANAIVKRHGKTK
ncbi:MAG TPA: hypothetical protein PKM65_19650 [Spirochaetota bacterium]|nr:hypothetical protein [Spirochaetota bacterium]HNT12954.1 hypothetical protein [Spirochaetota bacterium]